MTGPCNGKILLKYSVLVAMAFHVGAQGTSKPDRLFQAKGVCSASETSYQSMRLHDLALLYDSLLVYSVASTISTRGSIIGRLSEPSIKR